MKKFSLFVTCACLLSMAACIKDPHCPEPPPSTLRLVRLITEMRFENGVYTKEITQIDYNNLKKPALVNTWSSSRYVTDTSNLTLEYSDSIFYDDLGRVREAIRYDHHDWPNVKYGRRMTYTGTDTLPVMLAAYDSAGNTQAFTDTSTMIYYPNETVVIDHNEWSDNDTNHVTYVNGNFHQYGYSLSHSDYDSAINIERCFNLQHGVVLLLPFQDVRLPLLSLNNWRSTSGQYRRQILTYDSLNYVTAIRQEIPGKTVRNFRVEYANID